MPASSAGKSFWLLMQRAALMAAGTHLAFLLLFYSIDARLMVWINIGSIALFLASYGLLLQRRNSLGIRLIVLEIFLHAGLAVHVIGWDSGFHYYLIMMPPVIMLSPTRRTGSNLILVCITCAVYLGFDAFLRDAPPLHVLTPTMLAALRYFNIGLTFALLSLLATTYLRLVKRAERRLSLAAATDPLTGLNNRRRIMEVIRYWVTRRKREAAPLCFVVCDIDHFKRINDEHGHDAGDKVLVAVAETMSRTLREQDSVARWGGEEFLIVMPNTALTQAIAVAERLRQQIEDTTLAIGERTIRISLTLGVTEHHAEEDPEASIARADNALYRGKEGGRNRVVTAAGPVPA